jgi:hypothetical protein
MLFAGEALVARRGTGGPRNSPLSSPLGKEEGPTRREKGASLSPPTERELVELAGGRAGFAAQEWRKRKLAAQLTKFIWPTQGADSNFF